MAVLYHTEISSSLTIERIINIEEMLLNVDYTFPVHNFFAINLFVAVRIYHVIWPTSDLYADPLIIAIHLTLHRNDFYYIYDYYLLCNL